MENTGSARTHLETVTEPEPESLARARLIIVDKLGEWESLGVDELVESVCEAYEAPEGEPLRLADVDPASGETDTPALRHLRYARAARTALIDLVDRGEIVVSPAQPGDPAPEDAHDPGTRLEERVLATGPHPEGRRFTLARR